MYLGRIVERASVEEIFYNPSTPTPCRCCARSRASGWTSGEPLEVIKGSVPDPYSTVPGARSTRAAPSAMPGICDTVLPEETPIGDKPDHGVRCHLYPGELDCRARRSSIRETRPSADGPRTRGRRATCSRSRTSRSGSRSGPASSSGTVGHVKAVDGLDLSIDRGETFAIVGESGCGKSTTGRTILRLEKPTEGEVIFTTPSSARSTSMQAGRQAAQAVRPNMQIIFQDPFSSLDPRMTVGRIIAEPLVINNCLRGRALRDRIAELLTVVGLRPEHARAIPHAFSGGQRQRIGIARALALNPKLIICDEPVSALDVSVQAQVLNLLEELQDQFDLTYLFITHDLSVVEHISDRVAVMYVGKVVEVGTDRGAVLQPEACPTPRRCCRAAEARPAQPDPADPARGEVPSPANPPSGLLLPPALSVRTGHLQDRSAAAARHRRTATWPPATSPTNSSSRERAG